MVQSPAMRKDPPTQPSAISHQPSALAMLLRQIEGLYLFGGVLRDEIGEAYLSLLRGLAMERGEDGDSSLLPAYSRLFSLLASEVELRDRPLVGDAWQDHLLERLLGAENPFSLKAEQATVDAMGASLLEAARADMGVLRELFDLDGKALGALLVARLWGQVERLLPLDGFHPLDCRPDDHGVLGIKALLASDADWPARAEELAHHYASAGVGEWARCWAFRWVRHNGVGQLVGIAHPDRVRLDELVEYDVERALLLQNTEQFVQGFPANNVLLYGDRGTGKSSTVKALLQRYGDLGLRLVEVPKGLLEDFPSILGLLRGRRERFVLFVDDLSFDEQETAYKALKALLEGSVEARPENVVVYATSNRRHLVQERFSDRQDGDDEVRRWDTHQEKLSLADRFGVTLVFASPDQGRFLRIVESLASARTLEIDPLDLRRRALQWAAFQGGFSGRTARQFVDHLSGELGLAESSHHPLH